MSKPKRRCAVDGCKASEGDTEVHHRLPPHGELRKSWLRCIGLSVSEKRKCVYVCGRHFAADAYQRSPEVMKSMGFASRVLLKPNAMPTLHLPSVRPGTVSQQNLQGPSTSTASSIASAEATPSTQACHCTCHQNLLRAAATQTAEFQWTASTQTEEQSSRNRGARKKIDVKRRVAVGTQTDEYSSFRARKPARRLDAAPL